MKILTIYGGIGVFVDDDDFEQLSKFTWYKNDDGYVVSSNHRLRMHRYILQLHGLCRSSDDVHHRDDNKLNNQKENLVALSRTEHLSTRTKQSNNKSGFKGVTFKNGRWRATIGKERRYKHLGVFDSPVDAARAYDTAARNLFGPNACTNFDE